MQNKSDANFIATDFETATSKRASICEVGICVVQNGKIAKKRSWLVRPEDSTEMDMLLTDDTEDLLLWM